MRPDTIVSPVYYQTYQRENLKWYAHNCRPLFNLTSVPIDLNNIEQQYGLTEKQVIIELFRINGGKHGYYLGNLRDKKFYYCGESWQDIKTSLLALGIGRLEEN